MALAKWVWAIALTTGCTHPTAVPTRTVPAGVIELSWSICPVTRAPNGWEVDDGGVIVGATVVTGGTGDGRKIVVGHFPGACENDREPSPLPRLRCGEPHIDIDYVTQWSRPTASTLVLESIEYPIQIEDEAPATPMTPAPPKRQVVETLQIPPTARVTEGRPTGC
jgi:hypothetical protein